MRIKSVGALTMRTVGVVGWMLLTVGCGDSSKNNGSNGDDKRHALLQSWAQDVLLPDYRTFAQEAKLLLGSVESYHAVVAADEETREQARIAAQTAWRSAMVSWQHVELMQVGPAGSSGVTGFKGGQDLRDEIYSWPTVSACRVDQELVELGYERSDFFQTETVNTFGMDALEYLLFTESVEHACPGQVELDDAWAQLSDVQLRERRAAYAQRVTEYISQVADTLVGVWDESNGGFVTQFTQPGVGDSVYDDTRCAVDEAFAALFYIELRVKDRKLAIPAGLRPECAEGVCPDALESSWANHAKENILANYRGFELLFWGREGSQGFDDLLLAADATELEARIRTAFDAARVAIENIDGSLKEALLEEPDVVVNAHAKLKSLTDIVKTEFVSTLNLRVPAEGAGDND